MNPKAIILLFVLCSSNFVAQNLSSTFKEYIPAQVNPEEVNINLQYNASIHPDLIYYYLTFLDHIYNKKISNPNENYLNELRAQRSKLIFERNEWAATYIEKINEADYKRLKRNAMESNYEDLLIDGRKFPDNSNLDIDKNKMEFFEYVYLSNNNAASYNKSNDYEELNREFYADMNKQLEKDFAIFENYSDDKKEETIRRYLNFWYVVEKPELIYEMVVSTYENNFFEEFEFFVSAGAVPGAFQSHIGSRQLFLDKPLETFENPISHSFNEEVKYGPVAAFGLGVKIPLRDEYSMLSSLKLNLNYIYIINETKVDGIGESFFQFTYNIISGSEKEYYSYVVDGINNLNNHLITFNAVVPTFHFSKDLFVEVGLTFAYHYFKYSVDVDKQSIRSSPEGEQVVGHNIFSAEVDESAFSVFPTIAFGVGLSDNFQLNLQSLLSKSIFGLNAGINYIF